MPTYGPCSSCGAPIAIVRLAVKRPYTRTRRYMLCQACADSAEDEVLRRSLRRARVRYHTTSTGQRNNTQTTSTADTVAYRKGNSDGEGK